MKMEKQLLKKIVILVFVLPILIFILFSSCKINWANDAIYGEPGFKYKNIKKTPIAIMEPMEVVCVEAGGGQRELNDVFDYKIDDHVKEIKVYIKTIDKNGHWEKTSLKKLPKNVITEDLIKEETTDKENRFVITYDSESKFIALTTVFNNNKGSSTYEINYGRAKGRMGPILRSKDRLKIQKNRFIPLAFSAEKSKDDFEYEKYNTEKYLNYLLKHPETTKDNFGNCYMIGVEFN